MNGLISIPFYLIEQLKTKKYLQFYFNHDSYNQIDVSITITELIPDKTFINLRN